MSEFDDLYKDIEASANNILGVEGTEETIKNVKFFSDIFKDEINQVTSVAMKIIPFNEPDMAIFLMQMSLQGMYLYAISDYRNWLMTKNPDLDLDELEGRK